MAEFPAFSRQMPDYLALAAALWKHTAGGAPVAELAGELGTRASRIRSWEKGETPIRSSLWCILAKKKKLPLADLAAVVLAPRPALKLPSPWTMRTAQSGFIGSLLRELRGDRTLIEVQRLLGLSAWGTYHHWETGKRDIPLPRLLQAIDVLSSRLHSFCEAMHFDQSLEKFGLRGNKADFSERFFALPWTPTVFLVLHTGQYQMQKRHDHHRMARQLRLTREQIVEALKVLADLEMVKFDGKLYRPRRGQFYAPPTLTPAKLDQLHRYWFSRSSDLYEQPGLHKVEQHALSRESLRKIIGWVSDLRERIRGEVSVSKPETVVHIHWQVAEMLAPKSGSDPFPQASD